MAKGVVVVAVLATFSAVAIVIKGGEEGGGQGNVREVSARMQRIQSLLLPQGAFESPINPYLAPNDLFLFWGESSSTGTLSSQFNGGRGRASSGQRIRQVLRLGDFTGSGYEDSMSGHGKFLKSWEGAEFQALADKCCSTILVPPMERNLPIAAEHNILSKRIREFVTNGNMLVLTGGDYSSIVFLNQFFHFNLKKTVLDEGPFEKLPDRLLPENARDAWADAPQTLHQDGLSVTTITKASMPMDTKLIYATPVSSPVFEITYCQRKVSSEACSVMQPQSLTCLVDVVPSECAAYENKGTPCSCGSILYIGHDYVENHSNQIGTSPWDEALRAAAATDKVGESARIGTFNAYS